MTDFAMWGAYLFTIPDKKHTVAFLLATVYFCISEPDHSIKREL